MAGHESKPGTGETGGGGSPYNWDVLTDGQNTETYTIPEDQLQEMYTAEEGNWGNDDDTSVHFETVETGVPAEEIAPGGNGEEDDESDDNGAETENNQETFEGRVEGIVDNIGSYRPADVLRAAKKAGVSLPSYRPSKLKEYALGDPSGSRMMELMNIVANFSEEDTKAMNERKEKKGETGGKPKEEETAKPAEEAPVPPVETEAAKPGEEETAKPGEEETAKPTAEEETAEPAEEASAEEAPAEEASAEEASSEETPEETGGDNSEEEGDNSEEEGDSSEESGDNSEEGDGDSEETTEEEATAPIPPVPVPPVPVEGASEETGDDSEEDGDDSEGDNSDDSEGSDDNSEETGGDDSEEDDSDDSGEGDDSGEDNDDDSEEGEDSAEDDDDDSEEDEESEEEETSAETREKRSLFGERGKKIFATVAAIGIGLLAAFGIGSAVKKNNDAKAARDAGNRGMTYGTEVTGTTTTELTDDDVVRMATEAAAEKNHEGFSHEGGNWSIGLFADENGENSNPEKNGAYNIAPASVLEKFRAEGSLDTEEGQKEFKDTLSESWKDQAGSIAMVARAMSAQGGSELLPDSLKGMSGEQMEAAIVKNENGAYDDMCKVLDQIMENSTVEKTTLNGTYHNFYMVEYDANKPATKDNIDLVACEKNEVNTPAYEISGTIGDVDLVLLVKDECTQIVYKERIPDIPYITTTTTQPPSETTTTTTTTTTPTETTTTTPTETTTTPTETTTTPTETTTTPTQTTTTQTETTPVTTTTTQDVAKHEDALAQGQGGNVTPVQEGTRVTENINQVDLNGTTTTEAVSPQAQNANGDHAGDVNRTPEDAARQQQQEAAHQEQNDVNNQRGQETAAPVDTRGISDGI
ncbi:hypothetical protein IKM56_04510 [Candidatus Saccharibacteria bacterium]|nr:hypothetical protein [Candidatus Saccharibacteria bacterium]